MTIWKNLKLWQKALVVVGALWLFGTIAGAISGDDGTGTDRPERVEEADEPESTEPERTEAAPDTVPDDIDEGVEQDDIEVPEVPEAAEELPRSVILTVLEAEQPWFATVPRNITIDLIESTCEALDVGTMLEEIVLVGIESGVPEEATGAMVVAATTGWCPEHADLVTDFIETWGAP